jgi:hypothetical protein
LPLIDLKQVIDAKAWAKAWAFLQAMPYRRSGGFEPSGPILRDCVTFAGNENIIQDD